MSREGRNRDGRNPEERNPEWQNRQNRKDRNGAGPAPGGALLEAKYRKYPPVQASVLACRDQSVARAAVARAAVARRRRRARIALAAAAVAMILALSGLAARHMASLGGTRPDGPGSHGGPARAGAMGGGEARGAAEVAAAMASEQAAAWVATQVSGRATVACDEAMCAALAARGFPALGLTLLPPKAGLTGPDLHEADLVVATATVRNEFGSRLASTYAPQVIASFGTGPQRIQVRAVAPDGAAAYRGRLAVDLAARKTAGAQLLRNPSVGVSPAARTQIAAGRVDSRLLVMLATMAAAGPIQVRSFGDPDPGAGAGIPLRSVDVTTGTASAQATGLHRLLDFALAQRPPYQPTQARIAGAALVVQFAAPSPVGLLPSTAG